MYNRTVHLLITSRARDHALPPCSGIQMCHLIVCSPQLEAEDRLEVFALQENVAFQPITEVDRRCQGGLLDHIVNSGREYKT